MPPGIDMRKQKENNIEILLYMYVMCVGSNLLARTVACNPLRQTEKTRLLIIGKGLWQNSKKNGTSSKLKTIFDCVYINVPGDVDGREWGISTNAIITTLKSPWTSN